MWQSHADANGNSYRHCDGDSNSYTYSYSSIFTDTDGDGNCHSHGNCDCNPNQYARAKGYSKPEASPNAAAPPVGIVSRDYLTLMWELANEPASSPSDLLLLTMTHLWRVLRLAGKKLS